MMILLHYPPIAWYHLVYGDTDVIERTRREVEWTPEPGSPSIGLLQQLPSTFGEIFDHLYDTAYNPREWQMPPILAEIDRSMREAGKAAAGGIAEFNARAAEGARSLARTRLQQEMQGALARGDRKTYKRKLAELRKITPERY